MSDMVQQHIFLQSVRPFLFSSSRMHKITNDKRYNNGSSSHNRGCDLRVCFIALTYLIVKRGLSLIEPLINLFTIFLENSNSHLKRTNFLSQKAINCI